jgi:hypothetical protein
MNNWFDIIPPRDDIRRGQFDEAVFAADLGDVAAGTAAPDYNDPYLIFRKTYLIGGLARYTFWRYALDCQIGVVGSGRSELFYPE